MILEGPDAIVNEPEIDGNGKQGEKDNGYIDEIDEIEKHNMGVDGNEDQDDDDNILSEKEVGDNLFDDDINAENVPTIDDDVHADVGPSVDENDAHLDKNRPTIDKNEEAENAPEAEDVATTTD